MDAERILDKIKVNYSHSFLDSFQEILNELKGIGELFKKIKEHGTIGLYKELVDYYYIDLDKKDYDRIIKYVGRYKKKFVSKSENLFGTIDYNCCDCKYIDCCIEECESDY